MTLSYEEQILQDGEQVQLQEEEEEVLQNELQQYAEEEQQEFLGEEDDFEEGAVNTGTNELPFSLYERHKKTLDVYLNQKIKAANEINKEADKILRGNKGEQSPDNTTENPNEHPEEEEIDPESQHLAEEYRKQASEIVKYVDEINENIATIPPETYYGLLKAFGPSLLKNTEQIKQLNEKRESRCDNEHPERMTNDQLRESIVNLHETISNLDIDISNLRDDIDSLKKQYAIYQQKKKERELAAMTQHAKKSPTRSQKSKTSVTPSPKKKTGKK